MFVRQREHNFDQSLTGMRAEFDLFDCKPDPALDELVELAAVLCEGRYAYLGRVDSNRIWFRARYGFQALEMPRTRAACQWVASSGTPLLITDATQDMRMPPEGLEIPRGGRCRSYIGVPLLNDAGQVTGTLAVLSERPDHFRPEHLTLLEVLGRQAATRLELYERIRAQEEAQRQKLRSERALAMERGFVAAMLDSVPALVLVLDLHGSLVRANDSCIESMGLDLGKDQGVGFAELFFAGEEQPWARSLLEEAALGADSGPHESNWHVRRQDEAPRRIRWNLRPFRGPLHKIEYLIVSGQDVTREREAEREAQRAAEQALLSEEERYRQLVENSLGFLFTTDAGGKLSSLNEFTAQTLGLSAEDLIGHALGDLLDSAGALQWQDCLRELAGKGAWQGAIALRRSDGIYRRIALRSRQVNHPGEAPLLMHHGMDVTEQYEAEEALHLALRQRELILESAGDGIFGIDLEGRITFINHAGARLLGGSPNELVGLDLCPRFECSMTGGVAQTRMNSPILEAMRKRESLRLTNQKFLRLDGNSVDVEYTANPLFEDGRLSGMVVAFADISERNRLETMKDEFISTVSHELRTPLTSLRASLGLLASGTLSERPEKSRQMVQMAIENCDRLVQLVNNIVAFNKAKQGQLELNCRPVEGLLLLRRAADAAHQAATQAQISLRVAGVARVQVFADVERIVEVLGELVANAIKFSKRGSAIRLEARQIDGGMLQLSVSDQGRGIAQEKLGRIFDQFQQGDASDSRALGGTGLGLALCRSIAKQHGGELLAESVEGQGSSFHLRLPLAPAGDSDPKK